VDGVDRQRRCHGLRRVRERGDGDHDLFAGRDIDRLELRYVVHGRPGRCRRGRKPLCTGLDEREHVWLCVVDHDDDHDHAHDHDHDHAHDHDHDHAHDHDHDHAHDHDHDHHHCRYEAAVRADGSVGDGIDGIDAVAVVDGVDRQRRCHGLRRVRERGVGDHDLFAGRDIDRLELRYVVHGRPGRCRRGRKPLRTGLDERDHDRVHPDRTADGG
jgi:hypothetical protein